MATKGAWIVLSLTSALLSACGGGVDGSSSGGGGPSYVSWNGNANDTVIKDANNESFAVEVSTRSIVALAENTRLNGAIVDSSARVIISGQSVGNVVSAPSTSGSKIAVFQCNDGSSLDFKVTSSGWTDSCASTSSGAQAPGNSPPPAPSQASYITWNGSNNGAFVLGLNNELFRVRTGSGQVETQGGTSLNGLLVTGSTIVLKGSAIGSVVLTPGTKGGDVAVFRCANGNFLNIVVSSNQYSTDCGTGPTSPSPATSPSPPTPAPSPPAPGQPPVASCFAYGTTSSSQLTMVNNCSAPVYWSVCMKESAVFAGTMPQRNNGVTASGGRSDITLVPWSSIVAWSIVFQYGGEPDTVPSC